MVDFHIIIHHGSEEDRTLKIRTYDGKNRQIYNLPLLTAVTPLTCQNGKPDHLGYEGSKFQHQHLYGISWGMVNH